MSSFRRSKQTVPVYAGTRISPASNLSLVTSTGISSLDDILGGGVPLSCSVVFAAPDLHSSYGELIQKYFIAQGLANGQRVCVVGEKAERFARDVMWFDKRAEESDEEDRGGDEKVKIAWRYEKMKAFQTTVENSGEENYCAPFVLSSRVPEEVISEAVAKKKLRFVDVGRSTDRILQEISGHMEVERGETVRICIIGLGSTGWGDLTAQGVMYFLHRLRGLVREQSHGCASTNLAPVVSGDGWGGAGWLDKVGWASDGAVRVAGFGGNPGLTSAFPAHHGLVSVLRVPSVHTLSAPSDRVSGLRGLGSGGENNLGIKCTRKRLVVETVHLGAEQEAASTGTGAGAGKAKKKRVAFI